MDPVVDGEAASPPRQQQLDPLLAEQPPSAQESQDLVAEELLGRCLIHVRQGDPLPASRPASPGTSAWTCGWKFALSPKVWTTDTNPGRKPFSSTAAAAMSSLTVS